MKKNIGPVLALYPTPLTIIGSMVNGKANWLLAGHVGIIGHDRILVSLNKNHYSNKGIKENHFLSINLVDEALLAKADYVGCVSGAQTDKSTVFEYQTGKTGAPLVSKSPLSMDCRVVDIYETDTFESFICTIEGTYADAAILGEHDKIDYGKFKPVLFEMPTYSYLKTGDIIAKCRTLSQKA